MRRSPWDILLILLFPFLLGLGLGLAYAWTISPLRAIDSEPAALRTDFKDQFRLAIAASFAATGNLPRTAARLSLLADPDVTEALNSQAQRMNARGEFTQADQLAALAVALENENSFVAVLTHTSDAESAVPPASSATFPPPTEDLPFQLTDTPQVLETPGIQTQNVETESVQLSPTPRPTRTPVPTLVEPFALIAQDTVCDETLAEGLLQVMVFSSSRRQVTGAKIVIAWESGEDQFFTGLKPEIGNGYADFVMSPNIAYTLRLAAGSDIVDGLIAPTCQNPSGETFLGGIKLTFQQP
jgi:hypothetical protein